MKLVEVVRTIATDPVVYEEMVAFGSETGENSGARSRQHRDSS